MRYILLFACAFSISSSFGKESSKSKVENYYEFKNKAELYIIDSNYRESLENYKVAFTYKYPNARDLYNALVTAFLVSDSSASLRYFNDLVFNGLDKAKFEKISFFSAQKESNFYNWVIKSYDSIHGRSLSSSKLAYAKDLNKIYEEDQKARNELNNSPSKKQIAGLVDSDVKNQYKILSLISKRGFPGFEKVGLHEKAISGFPYASGLIWLLLWHSRNQMNFALMDAAKKGVQSGDYYPDEYALIFDFKQENDSYYYVLMPRKDVNGKSTFDPISEKKIKEINKRRASIYLESLEEYKKKIEYCQKDNRFHFYSDFVNMLNYAPMNFKTWKPLK